MATERAHYRFTAAEYRRMGEVGILPEDAGVELIAGEILRTSPTGRRHVAGVNRCNRLLSRALGARALVSVQNPVALGAADEPEPDVALLRPRADDYADGLPGPADVLLLIEVADSSLAYDRETKLPLYAAAGVAEAWVLNLREDVLEAHRAPGPAGYARTRTYRPPESVAAEAFPDVVLRVADLLPPPEPERAPDRQPERPQGRAADRARERGWELER